MFKPGHKKESITVHIHQSGCFLWGVDGETSVSNPQEFKSILDNFQHLPRNATLFVLQDVVGVHKFHLPEASGEDMRKMLSFQLEKTLPLSVDDLFFDYVSFPGSDNKQAVYAYTARKNIIEPYIRVLEEKHCRVTWIAPFSPVITASLAEREIGTDGATQWLIRENALGIDITLLYFQRAISFNYIAAQENIDPASCCEQAMSFFPEAAAPPRKVWIKANPRLAQDFERCMINGITGCSVTKCPQHNAIQWGNISQNKIKTNLPEFVTEKVRAEKIKRKKAQSLLLQLSLLVSLVLISVAIFNALVERKRQSISGITAYLESMESTLDTLRHKRTKAGLLEAQLQKRHFILKLLVSLKEITPSSITLNEFYINRNGEVSIKGQAEQLSQVFEFVPILEKASLIRSVSIQKAHLRPVGNLEYVDFELTFKAQFNADTEEEGS